MKTLQFDFRTLKFLYVILSTVASHLDILETAEGVLLVPKCYLNNRIFDDFKDLFLLDVMIF